MNAWLFGTLGLGPGDWLAMSGHFMLLSLLAVGGAITTVPDMHRYVVGQRGWLDDAQFTASIALAQSAPGPNVLFVAVIGFNVAGLVGVLATLTGTLLPSTALALVVARLGQAVRQHRGARAFTAGLAPLTIGLLLSTGWVLLEPVRDHATPWALVALTLLVMLRTKASPLWLMAAGALAGATGWV
jgi:chromate transporter